MPRSRLAVNGQGEFSMCGITGGIWTDPKLAIEPATLDRMMDVLRHRGPDDEGRLFQDFLLRPPYEPLPGVALGFRRLAVIDLLTGRQPQSNETGRIHVVCNGEIYNYKTLRQRLEGSGHQFRTHSDIETILHLYEDEGPDGWSHLNGMFAIALWDTEQRRLVLARDRLGKKPLFYRLEPGRLLFASEIKSLLQVPGVPRELDPSAIDEYLTYQYVPHPNTIFRGIHKLPPGHYAVFRDGALDVRPYWRPDFNFERELPEREYIAHLREAFESAVTLRMQSDVPLGVFLSGGIDSSLVAAVMRKHTDGQPVKTFSIGFPVPEFDESEFARTVARHLGTEHHEFQVTPSAAEILPKLVWHFDEPFADSSAVPTWYVSQMSREHVTVALTGDGGDELFAGYPRYQAVRLAERLDRLPLLRKLLAAGLWQRLPTSGRQRSRLRQFQRFSAALAAPPVRRYLDWLSIFDEPRRADLYTEEFLATLPNSDPFGFLETAWNRAGKRDAVTAASLADLTTYLPCDLLTKVDIASMAHSLECRQPFLDYRLVELAAAMPVRLKYRFGRGKRILRAAFGDLLPPAIWRRAKMGFGMPLTQWFRHELRPLTHDVLLDGTARSRGLFRPEAVRRLCDEHQSGRFDHGYRLWSLLVFELWMREWNPG